MSAVTSRITIEPDKLGGRPCIRGLRITVWDVLGWLGAGLVYVSRLKLVAELPGLALQFLLVSLLTLWIPLRPEGGVVLVSAYFSACALSFARQCLSGRQVSLRYGHA